MKQQQLQALHPGPLIDDAAGTIDPAHITLRRLVGKPVNCRWCGKPIAGDRPHWQECGAREAHVSAQKAALL